MSQADQVTTADPVGGYGQEPPSGGFSDVLLIILIALITISSVIINNYTDQVGQLITQAPFGFIFVLGILGAVGLYWLRTIMRRGYGVLEIFVGVGTALNTLFPGADLPTIVHHLAESFASTNFTTLTGETFLKLAAAIYIIIRGLDNYDQGAEKLNKKSLRKIFVGWTNKLALKEHNIQPPTPDVSTP